MRWIDRRKACLIIGLGGIVPFAALAHAEGEVSDWVKSDHARVRLIDAGPGPGGAIKRLAGLQIELDPSFLTYWRTPGEAGVAPIADFAGSENCASAELLFPAPTRFDEDGTEAFGYEDSVVFPILVTARDPTRPVRLNVSLTFAVCSKMCLPAQATCALLLAGVGQAPEASLVHAAMSSVPEQGSLGADGALAITAVTGSTQDDMIVVTARVPEGTTATLFVETADDWFLQAGAGTRTKGETVMFAVKILSRPKDAALANLTLRLTLVADRSAIEVATHLDAVPARP